MLFTHTGRLAKGVGLGTVRLCPDSADGLPPRGGPLGPLLSRKSDNLGISVDRTSKKKRHSGLCRSLKVWCFFARGAK